MGIRFYCPNGHKLHVKEFQAGRQGICPHCGISMEIPLASTRPSSKKRRGEDAGEEVEGGLVVHVGRNGGRPAQPRAAAAGPAVAGASTAPSPSTPPQGPASSIPRPGVPTPTPQRSVDPLDEIPTAVWYVRPPSGGQFGPATRDVMRSWIAEGRVSAESLVWREGWRDWSAAADIFPQFAAEPATSDHLDFLDDEFPVSTTSARKTAAAAQSASPAAGGSSRRLGLWIAGTVVALLVIGAIVAAVMSKTSS